MCVCILGVCKCVHVCVCMWRPEVNVGVFFNRSLPVPSFLSLFSSLIKAWAHQFGKGCPVSLWGSSCLGFSRYRFTGTIHACIFNFFKNESYGDWILAIIYPESGLLITFTPKTYFYWLCTRTCEYVKDIAPLPRLTWNSLCSPAWPQICVSSLASASWVFVLQVWSTTNGHSEHFFTLTFVPLSDVRLQEWIS